MGLSEQQAQVILDHIRAKARGGCPLCGQRAWKVEPELSFHGVFDPEYKQPVQGRIIPMVDVGCPNCFFTFQLPVMRLGVL